jgi:hypothetical protein
MLRRLQDELDLHRLLAIAHRKETPMGFLAGTAFLSGVVAGTIVALTLGYRAATGEWFAGIGPWVGLLALPVMPLVLVSRLRAEARSRQEQAGRALGDSMMLVAIMTDGRGLQLDDAVRVLARCVTNDALHTIVDGEGWARLIQPRPGSTIALYRAIAEQYRIPVFATVADAAANANLGFSERATYTAVATSVYAQRLSSARTRAARAKTLVTLPIAAMLIPLLLLLGAPALSTISNGFGPR